MKYRNESGVAHRVNGPVLDWPDGGYSWYYNGELHRYYGPAWRWKGRDYYYIFDEKIK